MHDLGLEDGNIIETESVLLSAATFLKLQAESEDFLEIVDPFAVLDVAFHNFCCLTYGDRITIEYNSKTYYLDVLETRSDDTVRVIECEVEVLK